MFYNLDLDFMFRSPLTLALTVAIFIQLSACEPSVKHDPGVSLILSGATVIDGLANPPRVTEAVVISGNRISHIGAYDTTNLPDHVRVINLDGKYLLPGFIDAHAHVTVLPVDSTGEMLSKISWIDSRHALGAMLMHGVTSLRNPGAPADDGVALRDSVANGTILGPSIRTAGNPLNRTALNYGPFIATPDSSTVKSEIARQAKLGVGLIKLYASLPPDLVLFAIEEAHRHGLPVIGHLQRAGWTDAANAMIDGLCHVAPWSAEYLPESMRTQYRGSFKDRVKWLRNIDPDGLPLHTMIEAIVENRVVVDPTLVALHAKFFANEKQYRQAYDNHLVPPAVRHIWQRYSFTARWTPDDYRQAQAAWPIVLDLVHRYWKAGVILAAGSDFPNPGVLPGAGLHQEMELLADAGIPPVEVIRIATYNGALAAGTVDETGSIEVGKEADLVILAQDPVDDVTNTRSVELVITDGIVVRPDSLMKHLQTSR